MRTHCLLSGDLPLGGREVQDLCAVQTVLFDTSLGMGSAQHGHAGKSHCAGDTYREVCVSLVMSLLDDVDGCKVLGCG